jgi:hypothetical protein
MDSERFDTLARSLTKPRTRRSLAHLLGALSLGGILSAQSVREAAAAKRIGGAACMKGSQCKTGKCAGPAGQKTCSCSKKFPNCSQPTDGSFKICCQGTCITGSPCPGNHFCGNSADGCGGTVNCGTCQGGEVCEFTATTKECVCSIGTCNVNGDCFASAQVCQAGTNGLKCCCNSDGFSPCTPGPNTSCCSGFCTSPHDMLEPPESRPGLGVLDPTSRRSDRGPLPWITGISRLASTCTL